MSAIHEYADQAEMKIAVNPDATNTGVANTEVAGQWANSFQVHVRPLPGLSQQEIDAIGWRDMYVTIREDLGVQILSECPIDVRENADVRILGIGEYRAKETIVRRDVVDAVEPKKERLYYGDRPYLKKRKGRS